MKTLLGKYRSLLKNKRYVISLMVGFLMLAAAGWISGNAVDFTNEVPSNWVRDLILDNLPAFPWPNMLVDFLVMGAFIFAISLFVIALLFPEHLPAAFKTVAMLYAIRSVFLIVTHLQVYPGKLDYVTAKPFLNTLAGFIYNSNDLFFSAHTALPIMGALIFWNIKAIRYYLLLAAVAFAVGVLLAKVHYSIDVLAAPFMAYAIFVLAQKFFKKDFALIEEYKNYKLDFKELVRLQ